MSTSTKRTSVDLPIEGMDCADEANHIETAVWRLPGVHEVRALVAAQRATVTYDPDVVTPAQIVAAIGETGCRVREESAAVQTQVPAPSRRDVGQIIGWGALGMVAVVVLVAALGERLGVFDAILDRLPWWIPGLAILLGGWGVFRGVLQAARRAQVTSHTLMTAGVIASAAIGQWTTAALIVFFMRFADWLEELTTERSRQALQQLVAVFLSLLTSLAVAAPCWGHDSRDRLVSAEERLAAWGFTWRDRVADGWDPEWWERAWRRSDAAAAAQRRLLARPARASSTG